MSSDSELDEFFDAEEATPRRLEWQKVYLNNLS
jgi:hypothetical protein